MKYKKYISMIVIVLTYLILSIPLIHAQEINYVLDANGNLISGDNMYREYDDFNQLVRIRENNTVNGKVLEEYVWHPTEERIAIKRVFYNNTLNYTVYYVDENYILVKNSSGTFKEKYIYQDGILVAQVNSDGRKLAVHTDIEGSTSFITNGSGNVIENVTYSPFGEILSGGKDSRFDSEGKEYDSVVQDYDFHFRKYKPEIGMFVQPDSLIPNVFDPQLLNRYAFERNNPYRYTDPTGHQFIANPYEMPAIQADQSKAGGLLQIGAEANEVWINTIRGIEVNRQSILKEYDDYYEVTDILTREGRQRGGPTYEELMEWKEARSLRDKDWLDRAFSVEKNSVISTQKTSFFSNILGTSGSSDLYKNVAALGGKVEVRDKGVRKSILAVYYRMVDGKKILRYQHFKDEKDRKKWEKSHKDYKLMTIES